MLIVRAKQSLFKNGASEIPNVSKEQGAAATTIVNFPISSLSFLHPSHSKKKLKKLKIKKQKI